MILSTPASQSLHQIAESDFQRLRQHIAVDEIRGKKILITGATGFFGAWLLSLFDWLNRTQDAGCKIFAVSRNPENFLGQQPHFKNAGWLEWIRGDVRSFVFSDERLDCVIHAATDTSAAAGSNPMLLFDTIIQGTKHVLDCAERNGATRILLTSSGAIYGPQPAEVTHVPEDRTAPETPLEKMDAYSEGKRLMEMMGSVHAEKTGSTVIVARCFAFTGAGLPLDGHFAIGNFIRDALTADAISIKGGGTAERSYLYAADLAIWLLRLLVSGQNGQTYNVGSDQTVSIAELARRTVAVLSPGKHVHVLGKDDPNRGRNRYIPSIDKARKTCELDVWTPLEQAISLTASYKK